MGFYLHKALDGSAKVMTVGGMPVSGLVKIDGVIHGPSLAGCVCGEMWIWRSNGRFFANTDGRVHEDRPSNRDLITTRQKRKAYVIASTNGEPLWCCKTKAEAERIKAENSYVGQIVEVEYEF